MKKKIFVLAAMIICSRLQAQIEDSTGKLMDEVIFTANKYPNKTSLTGKVLTIITRQELERSGGRTLAQVLNEQPGLYINGANSNPGKDKSVYLRGARAEHTLITIDGVPVYDPSGVGSNFDIRNMTIDNIERIEILKGSQSTLYGSDAIAGVINIITRKPDPKSFTSSGIFSFGSHQTFRGNIGIRGNSNIIDYNASYTHYRTSGIDETINKNNIPGTDKDGFEQNNIQAGIRLQPNKNTSMQVYARYSKLDGKIDQGAFIDELDYTYLQKSYQAGIRNEFTIQKAKLTLLYNYNHIERLYIDDSVKSRNGFDIYSRGSYKGSEHFSDAYLTISAGKNSKITAGADFRSSRSDQEYFSEGFFGSFTNKYASDSLKQNQAGVYTAININTQSGFNLEIGNRLNFHSEYGANYIFNLNPSYLLNKKVKVFANISNAYRTPSLYQLFSEYGNKNLRPESAFSTETGIQYYSTNNKITGRAVFFRRNVKDIIFFYFNPVTFGSQYINQDRQKDYGGEFETSFNITRKTILKIFYSYVNGKITTKQNGKDTTFFNLLRRPKHSVGLSLSYQPSKRLYIGTNLLAFGKRNDAYFDTQTFQTVYEMLNSYMLLDVYSEYSLYKNRIKLFVDFRNVTNSKFTEVSGFNTIGLNVYGGVRFIF